MASLQWQQGSTLSLTFGCAKQDMVKFKGDRFGSVAGCEVDKKAGSAGADIWLACSSGDTDSKIWYAAVMLGLRSSAGEEMLLNPLVWVQQVEELFRIPKVFCFSDCSSLSSCEASTCSSSEFSSSS